jgi:hypothetical protein
MTFAYMMNQMAEGLIANPSSEALSAALYEIVA